MCVCVRGGGGGVGGWDRGLWGTFCVNNIFYFVSGEQREGKQHRIVVSH